MAWHSDPEPVNGQSIPDIYLHDLEMAWTVWMWLESVQWKHLIVAGGVLDQPEALWHDVMAISQTNSRDRFVKGKLRSGIPLLPY